LYKGGATDFLDVLSAKQTYLQDSDSLNQARREHALAVPSGAARPRYQMQNRASETTVQLDLAGRVGPGSNGLSHAQLLLQKRDEVGQGPGMRGQSFPRGIRIAPHFGEDPGTSQRGRIGFGLHPQRIVLHAGD
jgi:hypothetical protein